MVLTQEVVVAVYQFCLTYGREQLPLFHGVHLQSALQAQVQLSPTRCHGTGRNENDLYATVAQFGNLVYERRKTRHVQSAVGSGKHCTAYLYGYSFHAISSVHWPSALPARNG